MINNPTTFIEDTRENILDQTPTGPGQVAIASDTLSLFVSNSAHGWVETRLSTKHNITYNIPDTSETITQSPVMHFDASDTSKVLNTKMQPAQDGDDVRCWVGKKPDMLSMFQKQDLYTPRYIHNDQNNNKAIDCVNAVISTREDESVDLTDQQTVIIVYTPQRLGHLVRGHLWDNPALSATNYYGGSEDEFRTSYVQNYIWYGGDQKFNSADSFGVYTSINDYNFYMYNQEVYSITLPRFSNINEGEKPGFKLSNADILRYQHYNQNYLGNPHIMIFRSDTDTNEIGGSRATMFGLGTYSQTTSGGNTIETKETSNSPGSYIKGLTLGGYPNTDGDDLTEPSTGNTFNHFHEVMVFNSALSNHELNLLGRHLASKWNIENNQYIRWKDLS